MNILSKKTLVGLKIIGTQVVKLLYSDNSYQVVSNTVWSTHRDCVGGTLLPSGMLHLFQNGAGAGFGYLGFHVSTDTPLKISAPGALETVTTNYTTIDAVSTFFVTNINKTKDLL